MLILPRPHGEYDVNAGTISRVRRVDKLDPNLPYRLENERWYSSDRLILPRKYEDLQNVLKGELVYEIK